jgi:Uma2 family endonuclease
MSSSNQTIYGISGWDDPGALGLPLLPPRMTEAEFEAWCNANPEVRAEWVDGEVQMMTFVTFDHADLNAWFISLLRPFVERRKLGKIAGPEFQVRLPNQRRRRVPDILFVEKNRENLLQPNYLDGPPDLAIEIVSPESVVRDWREKFLDYQMAGVREYWIADPLTERIEAYELVENRTFARIEPRQGAIYSGVLAGFFIRPEWLWSKPRADVLDVLVELGVLEA